MDIGRPHPRVNWPMLLNKLAGSGLVQCSGLDLQFINYAREK